MYKYHIKTIHLGISAVIYEYDMICDICDVCDMSLRIPWSGKKNITSTRFHPGNLAFLGTLKCQLRQFLHQPIEEGANLLKDESGKTNIHKIVFPSYAKSNMIST